MERNYILQQLYNRYIEPTKKPRECFVGVEFEMPIVNLNNEPVDFHIVHNLTKLFCEKFTFAVVGIDDNGNVFSAQNRSNGDILSYDCSYNNLELSFGKEKNLNLIHERFLTYYGFIQEYFSRFNYTLTGMGVNPNRNINHNVPIETGRYRMLFHHLHSFNKYNIPMYFHKYPEYGTFSSASQVQLDVDYDDLPLVLNTFSLLEPVKALIFSNSVLLGENEDVLCCRDMFWENSPHGINSHNIGMYDCTFGSAQDILNYIATTSIYCTERDGKYINFEPINIIEYFVKETIVGEYCQNGEYYPIEFSPDISDLNYLRTFKFEDLTFRGTVEFRSVCCQPVSDCMCVSAFHLGLMNKVNDLKNILENDTVLYHHGYTASELRKFLIKRSFPEFIDKNALYRLAKQIVDLSFEGLSERGFGEEVYLTPLYERISQQTNPADKMLADIANGISLNEIIKKYAEAKR